MVLYEVEKPSKNRAAFTVADRDGLDPRPSVFSYEAQALE